MSKSNHSRDRKKHDNMAPQCRQLADDVIARLQQGISLNNPGMEGLASVKNPSDITYEGFQRVQLLGRARPLVNATGVVHIMGAMERDGVVQYAIAGVDQPEFFALYIQRQDRTLQWFVNYSTESQARYVAQRLADVLARVG